jgi:putative transposase
LSTRAVVVRVSSPNRGFVARHEQDDDATRRTRAQQVALFRYQLICPALDPDLSSKARGRVVRAIAARTHAGPFGGEHRYSRDTLDRWIRRYRAGGLDALAPSTRQPGSRIDTTVLELAAALKRENPDRTAAQVVRILRASSGWSPSESTLLRLFHRHDLMGPAAGDTPGVFGRFEAAAPNERWVGDALHGPRVGGRKTYLFAFLDDHSRLAVGYRFGYAEDTVRLAAALQPALAARGVPATVYVDNGSAYVDSWLLRACGKLGIRLIHSTPHRPQGRGKIERWFRGVRDQFLVEVADTTEQLAEQGLSPAAALLELNALFTAWVESVYHHRVHTETGQTPLARWDDGWQAAGHGPAMASAEALTEAFLWSEWRTVTKTATVSLHGNTYQVEPVLVGRKVELVFSPFNLEVIEVHYRNASYGRAVPHRITRHAHPKARPETPEPAPAPATGIAYLHLVADAHQQQVAAEERIGFHALYSTVGTDPGQPPGQLPGQLSIDDALAEDVDAADAVGDEPEARA